jgi:hypothetical protein
MYGFSLLPDVLGGVLIFAGVAALIGFLQWESRTASPVLNVFRNNRPCMFSVWPPGQLASFLRCFITFPGQRG